MSHIKIENVGGQSVDRINKLLAGIPGGAIKAASSALKRAGDAAKTQAGRFAAAEYTINKGDFMRNTTIKTKSSATTAGVASMSISYVGSVLPLLTFNTSYARDGSVRTQVKRNGGAQLLEHVFVAKIGGHTSTYERIGKARFPLEQKYGPSTGHMMRNEDVIERMDETVRETFERRAEHEIMRVLNGWGGRG